jgi:hypothetical protein
MLHENTCPEAEFMDAIGTKVLRVFLLALLKDCTPPPPPRAVCHVNIVYGNLMVWYDALIK